MLDKKYPNRMKIKTEPYIPTCPKNEVYGDDGQFCQQYSGLMNVPCYKCAEMSIGKCDAMNFGFTGCQRYFCIAHKATIPKENPSL